MNQDELKQEISKDKIRNFYIFCADDYFLKHTYVERLSKVSNCDIQKFEYESFAKFNEDYLHLCAMDLFSSKVIKYVKLDFELDKLVDFNTSWNIIILDPIHCSSKLKSSALVKFRPLNKKEIEDYLVSRAKNIDAKLVAKISDSPFYSNATALYLLKEKFILSGCFSDIEFLDKELSIFEAVDAIINRNFKKFCEFLEKYTDYPLKLIATLSTIFFNTFLELNGLLSPSKPYYTKILQSLGDKKVENLVLILYNLDTLYKSTNIKNLLPLKLKIYNWMVEV